ncbi:hypothetical protein E2320_019556, partial [Naja naja]
MCCYKWQAHRHSVQQGQVVPCIWEHEWDAKLVTDGSLKQFTVKKKPPAHLYPQDAFFKDRTNVTHLYYKQKSNEKRSSTGSKVLSACIHRQTRTRKSQLAIYKYSTRIWEKYKAILSHLKNQ